MGRDRKRAGAAQSARAPVRREDALSASSARPDVAIVGGGVAGIAAALRCASAGASTVLLEVRPRLGGAAYSVQREGLTIDNGQHVFLRCCTAYTSLLRRIGSEQKVRLQQRLEIPLLRPGQPRGALRRNGLPAPLHLLGALMAFPSLTRSQRLRAAGAVAALSRIDPSDPAVDRIAMGRWLAEHGQDEHTIATLWDLLVLPTVNLRASEASLALGAFVFQKGLLERADAGDIGFHAAPLSETIGEPALKALEAAGVQVRLRWRCSGIVAEGGGVCVLGAAGGRDERLTCDTAILALPHLRAAALLQCAAGEAEPLRALGERVAQIGVSPIVNLHVLYDRQVLDLPFAAGVDSPIQYVFDRTDAGGAPSGTQYLAVSLSGADEEMRSSPEQLRERYLPAVEQVLPKAKEAKVLKFMLTREHAATFRGTPGVGSLRPGPRTPLRGLLLAGAWTDTGWPATLEGAVRSGEAAAEAALTPLAGRQAQRSPYAPCSAQS